MKKSLLIIPLLLAGCAKVSDYQASCEQRCTRRKLSGIAIMVTAKECGYALICPESKY
ncbi:hypothetical protein MZD82_14660 [Escherichia coli]|nr:hypothetical protein [Escherichia coli]